MAYIAHKNKEMKYRVDIFYLMETVEYSSYNIADTLGQYPEEYPSIDTLIKMVYCNKDDKSHQHKAGCLDIVMLL